MPTTGLRPQLEGFSAEGTRERHARSYIRRIRPALVGFSLTLTLLEYFFTDAAITTQVLWVLVGFVLVQTVLLALLRAGVTALTTVGMAFLIDGVLFICLLPFVAVPTNAAASIVILVVAIAYFRPAWETLLFTIVMTCTITIVGPQVDAWNDPAPFPASAFTVLISGLLISYLTNRMRQTETQLEHVVEQQRTALERLKQVNQSRDRLIANVSHELRTPLTSTIGFLETLDRADIQLSEDQRSTLMRHALDGSHRLLDLVEDLLTLGATRPDSLHLEAEPSDVRDIVRDALHDIEPPSGREIHVYAPEPVRARVDRRRTRQVVANLISNAIRHGAGTIDVRVIALDDAARIEVIDDGTGVAEANVSELFLPFARFSDYTGSTGLGLAICRAIIELHAGTINYDRTPDNRTRFTIELPRACATTGITGRALTERHPN